MTAAAPETGPTTEAPTVLAEVRASSHARALADLFGRRPDLAGVYSPADLATEAVRWSA
ncbi:hypothetical protein GCM10009795_027230 [Nocardioides hankookensis]|uniref:Uncharacterized protein n=1 Tax=Nocardioides hankookensis TaxID=443157 RepID=A0ABW1LCP1_9ACTN